MHALSLDSIARVVAKVLMALIAIGIFAYFAGPEFFQSRLMAVFASAGAFVAAFVLILLVNVLFITPAKLDCEAAAKVKSLEEQLQQSLKQQSTQEERQAVIDDLAEEINWATQNLLNPKPHPLKDTDPSGYQKVGRSVQRLVRESERQTSK